MGTVKVYDGIIGKKLREAAAIAGTTQGEVLGCLVVLWQWAIDNANADGVVEHSGRKDVIKCVSAVSDDLYSEVADALFQTGFIEERDGCLVFDEWKSRQAWHYKEEAARKRDTERKRAERMKTKNSLPVVGAQKPQEPVKAPEVSPEQPAEPKKKKPSKKHYAEFVLMTQGEYEKLCGQYGEPLVQKGIEILNQYIGSTGKSYKSHYMTMIGWPIKEAIKQNSQLFAEFKKSQTKYDDNPFAEYMEG